MVDRRTPVIVGVGEFAERVDDRDYRGLSPVDLAAEAVRAALRDTEADFAAVTSAVDTAAGMRQFETSHPYAPAPLGRSNNYPRSVANRVGLNPRRLILEVVGGDGPQKLVNEMVAAIAGDPGARTEASKEREEVDLRQLDVRTPDQEFLVMDADSSQLHAIAATVRGQG